MLTKLCLNLSVCMCLYKCFAHRYRVLQHARVYRSICSHSSMFEHISANAFASLNMCTKINMLADLCLNISIFIFVCKFMCS